MMRQYEIVEKVKKHYQNVDDDLLNRAYIFAMNKHGSQRRKSGEPYFQHPLEVAGIVAEFGMDHIGVASALLHDTLEDTNTTRAELDRKFGPEVGEIVEGLTKVGKLADARKSKNPEDKAPEIRKLFHAIVKDARVLLIKLADRLHNMRTIEYLNTEQRERIAAETLEIYAPLAERIGVQTIREELEDISFKISNPEAYENINNSLDKVQLQGGRMDIILHVKTILEEDLKTHNIKAEVTSRRKRPYAIFRKMKRKSVEFSRLSDIIGFRVIVDDYEDCYRILGLAHKRWAAIPHRIKDYISKPKRNEYRALHTTVIGPYDNLVELQIRTREMDRTAEFGIAAHALYRDEATNSSRNKALWAGESKALRQLRSDIKDLVSGTTLDEFISDEKLTLFDDQIYCSTPMGQLIALNRGSTPIDFAYAVHTRIGNTCSGCTINGVVRPIYDRLENGDEVKIIRSHNISVAPEWRDYVKTPKAKNGIKLALKAETRRLHINRGRAIIRKMLQPLRRNLEDAQVRAILSDLNASSVSDLYSLIGSGQLGAVNVVKHVHPDIAGLLEEPEQQEREDGWFKIPGGIGLKFQRTHNSKDPLPENISFQGGPLPGERIVGIFLSPKTLGIFPIHSPRLKQYEGRGHSWVDVRWENGAGSASLYAVPIEVQVRNEPGMLAIVAGAIGKLGGNIDEIAMLTRAADFHRIRMDLEVRSVKHLHEIIAALGKVDCVSGVLRYRGE